jgi:hypothetical protein
MSQGVYNWIRAAADVLRASLRDSDVSLKWGKEINELLSGVPVPNEDLGFNSPADRAARAEQLGAVKLLAALEAIRDLWPWDTAEPPMEEDYDDTESAYNNGHDVATFRASLMARDALVGLDVTKLRY